MRCRLSELLWARPRLVVVETLLEFMVRWRGIGEVEEEDEDEGVPERALGKVIVESMLVGFDGCRFFGDFYKRSTKSQSICAYSHLNTHTCTLRPISSISSQLTGLLRALRFVTWPPGETSTASSCST